LGIEPRIFGLKVNTGAKPPSSQLIYEEKSSIYVFQIFFAENLFSKNEVRANIYQTRKTVNFAGFDGASAIQPKFVFFGISIQAPNANICARISKTRRTKIVCNY
jgi:hypothetical protein